MALPGFHWMLHQDAFTATKKRLKQPAVDALEAAIRADVVDWSARF